MFQHEGAWLMSQHDEHVFTVPYNQTVPQRGNICLSQLTPATITISNPQISANTITIGRKDNKTILRITREGDVKWDGKPSQAAEHLKNLFVNMIDAKIAEPVYRQRTYARACRSILHQIRSLNSREEIIDYLVDMVDRRDGIVLEKLLSQE